MAAKKLQKAIENTIVKITVMDGAQGDMSFDFATLPADIQAKLGPFGLGHKLGDAAAGKKGTEAEEAITKVFEGLTKGEWSVRLPAAEKVSTKEIKANFGTLNTDEQEAARLVLEKLGFKIPGITKAEEPQDTNEEVTE